MSEASSTPEAVKPSRAEEKQMPSLKHQLRYRNRIRRGSDELWRIYGENIRHYQKEFNAVLHGETIVNFVKSRESPVVIDFMGPSDTIASLFKKLPPDKPKYGLAISLDDIRSRGKVKRDEKLNIQQLAGDITESSTWKEINDRLQGRKADLIMERAQSGVWNIPLDAKLYAILINKAWQMLSEQHGMLLVQVPDSIDLLRYKIPITRWVNYLKEKGIDADYRSISRSLQEFLVRNTFGIGAPLGSISYYGSMKLIKTPDSPKDLPFLNIPGNVNLDQKPAA